MDRRGDHESVIAGGRYGNRRQRASQPLAAARRERQWQTSVQSLPFWFSWETECQSNQLLVRSQTRRIRPPPLSLRWILFRVRERLDMEGQ